MFKTVKLRKDIFTGKRLENIKNILLISILGIGFLFLIRIIKNFDDAYFFYPYPKTFLGIIYFSMFILDFLILINRKLTDNIKQYVILFIFSAGNFLFFYYLYRNTLFGTYGMKISLDIGFKVSFLVKMVYFKRLLDGSTKGLHMFYAPLYWIFLALISFFFSVEPFMSVKIGFLIGILIAPIISFKYWKKLIDGYQAMLIVILFFINIILFYKMDYLDHYIPLLLLIPYIFYNLEDGFRKYSLLDEKLKSKSSIMGKDEQQDNNQKSDEIQEIRRNIKKKKLKLLLSTGIIGAVIFTGYFMYFLLIFIYLMLDILSDFKWNIIKKKINWYMRVFILVFMGSSFFIFPLLFDILKFGMESHQNYYISDLSYIIFPEDDFSWSLITPIYILGLFYLLIGSKDPLVSKLRRLFVANILLFFVGLILIWIGIPISHFRFAAIFTYIFIVSGVLFFFNRLTIIIENVKKYFAEKVEHQLTWSSSNISEKPSNNKSAKLYESDYFLNDRIGKHELINKSHSENRGILSLSNLDVRKGIVGFMLLIIIFNANLHAFNYMDDSIFKNSYESGIPHKLISQYKRLDLEGKVFLTNNPDIITYLPIYLFISSNPHYSHPSAHFSERMDFLLNLSLANTTEEFNYTLSHSPFERIDFFDLGVTSIEGNKYLYYNCIFEKGFSKPQQERILFNYSFFKDRKIFRPWKIGERIFYEYIGDRYDLIYPDNYDENNQNQLIEQGGINKDNITFTQIDLDGNDELINFIKKTATEEYYKYGKYYISNKIFMVRDYEEGSALLLRNTDIPLVIFNCTFLYGNFIDNKTTAGLYLKNVTNVLIQNSRFINNSNGIYVSECINIRIFNSSINWSKWSGVAIYSSRYVRVDSSFLKHSYYQSIYISNSYGITVINTIIDNDNQEHVKSVLSLDYGIKTYNSYQLNIVDTVIGNYSRGLHMGNTFLSNITRLNISNCEIGLKLISSYYIIAKSSFISNSSLFGIYANNIKYVDILLNNISFSQREGFVLISTTKSNFMKNTLEKNGYYDFVLIDSEENILNTNYFGKNQGKALFNGNSLYNYILQDMDCRYVGEELCIDFHNY